jgi:transposase
MIQVTPHMKLLVAHQPVDFRKGIDGLVRICKDQLEQDPFAGTMFVFRNRPQTGIKILVYDGQGFLALSQTSF